MKISVAIITKNEEEMLGQTLLAVQDLADEIVIVDSYSTDKTKDIAESFGARFYEKKWEGFSAQKNYLIDQCEGDWILLIDADEVLSHELIAETKQAIKDDTHQIYEFMFHSYCYGKLVRFGGWSGFYKIRLFKNGVARFGSERVHEKFIYDPKLSVGRLKSPLQHYTYLSMDETIDKMNSYSTASSLDAFSKQKKSSILKIIFSPLLMFLKAYIIKGGFLDGFRGFILAIVNAIYHFLKYSKLYLLNEK
ncbi:MAG: glycosyltransferase family 2 protein [Candidatus Cloacimonetes bacterium]|nr:glycosyltransferase family 2 protein [Candidatus Cloacimonadota bacterium]